MERFLFTLLLSIVMHLWLNGFLVMNAIWPIGNVKWQRPPLDVFSNCRFHQQTAIFLKMSRFLSVVDRAIMVKHRLPLLAVLINGISSKFCSSMVLQWMWSVKCVTCTKEMSDRLRFHSLFQVETNGNTIFHLLVIHNLPEMYIKFKKHWEEVQRTVSDASSEGKAFPCVKPKTTPLWKYCNNDGLTPLTLAAKLGATDMFSFLLDERKIVQWRYGPISCVLYPLDEIDLGFQEVSTPIDRVHQLIFVSYWYRIRIHQLELLN